LAGYAPGARITVWPDESPVAINISDPSVGPFCYLDPTLGVKVADYTAVALTLARQVTTVWGKSRTFVALVYVDTDNSNRVANLYQLPGTPVCNIRCRTVTQARHEAMNTIGGAMGTDLPAPLTTWYVLSGRTTADNLWVSVNDTISAPLPVMGTLRDGACTLSVGLAPIPWFAFDGKIAELLAWNQALSDADLLAAYAYLKTKYSLP